MSNLFKDWNEQEQVITQWKIEVWVNYKCCLGWTVADVPHQKCLITNTSLQLKVHPEGEFRPRKSLKNWVWYGEQSSHIFSTADLSIADIWSSVHTETQPVDTNIGEEKKTTAVTLLN